MSVRFRLSILWTGLCCVIVGPNPLQAERLEISVIDSLTQRPVPYASVAIEGQDTTSTDGRGHASLAIPSGVYGLAVWREGYQPLGRPLKIEHSPTVLVIYLKPVIWVLPETLTKAETPTQAPGDIALSTTELRRAPSPSPDPLRFVKVLPGVSSNNDMSSTYNVMGGNHQENLVYINGIQLEGTLLQRRGVTEGLSPLNPALIDQAYFRAGAFPVQYGERLSSVLDINYRIPTLGWRLSGEYSLQDQNLAFEGAPSDRLSFLGGIRRANRSRQMKGAQISGVYKPLFWDAQGQIHWKLGPRSSLSLYGVLLHNRFDLEPTQLKRRYNCRAPLGCDEFRGQGQGNERVEHRLKILGLRWAQEDEHRHLKAYFHRFEQEEQENTAIDYAIRWVPLLENGSSSADIFSTEDIDAFLRLTRLEGGGEGQWRRGQHQWTLGAQLRSTKARGHERVAEHVGNLAESFAVHSANRLLKLERLRPSLYGQYRFEGSHGLWQGGIRYVYLDDSGQHVLLPRMTYLYPFVGATEIMLAVGRYAQPPLIVAADPDRPQSEPLKAQKADQASLGLSWQANPALKWRSEVFYRRLTDLVPYQVDDLRIVYSDHNNARGYTYGAKIHLRGQIAGMVGLLSYTYLVAKEDIAGDGKGFLPRPTDQRHALSAYWEDHMDLRWQRLHASRFHLRLLLGSGYPFTPKLKPLLDDGALVDGPRNSRRGQLYWRFDIGMNQELDIWGHRVQLREEIANLFDNFNVVGYTYLPTPDGALIPLRKSLGWRIYNIRLTTAFD